MATRKLKFGSPAWQKKYNPAFKGGKKRVAKKRPGKMSVAAKKALKARIEAKKQRSLKALFKRVNKGKPANRRTTKKATTKVKKAKVGTPSEGMYMPVFKFLRAAKLLKLSDRERAAIISIVNKRLPTNKV